VYTAPKAVGQRGTHRVEIDRTPLGSRVSAIAVAASVLTGGTAAAAYAVTAGGGPGPLAEGLGQAAFGDTSEAAVSPQAIETVRMVNPGNEVGRLLQFEQMYATQNFQQSITLAQAGFAGRQQAAAEQAAAEAEARKSPHQRQVEGWIKEAIKVLQANGTNIDESSIPAIYTIIEKESGGNPNAVNTWDSNAARGTPSKGLMQCIDPTFRAYKIAGYDDILNPVDNIIAGVRYTYDRYGGFDNHPGLVSISVGGGYRGY
jgi:soluble lytic murein transglycosylase-like protein